MAYTPIGWIEGLQVTPTRLNIMENIYAEAVAGFAGLKAATDRPVYAEVRDNVSGYSQNTGHIVLDRSSGNFLLRLQKDLGGGWYEGLWADLGVQGEGES